MLPSRRFDSYDPNASVHQKSVLLFVLDSCWVCAVCEVGVCIYNVPHVLIELICIVLLFVNAVWIMQSVWLILFWRLLLTSFWSMAHDDECRLWLAPSYTSTDKRTKYGIFAGISYRENESLPMAEIAIPLIEDMIDSYNRNTNQHHTIPDITKWL
jgi:hypothetical protein